MRIRKGLHNPKADNLDIFSTSPERKENRRGHTRRNSDTSVLDVKLEARNQSRKDKDAKGRDGKPRSKKPNRQVDVIDKLDATGMFGVGCKQSTPETRPLID